MDSDEEESVFSPSVSPDQGFGAGADSFPPAGRRRHCVTMASLVRLQVQLTNTGKTIVFINLLDYTSFIRQPGQIKRTPDDYIYIYHYF